MALKDLRTQIDALDDQILALLEERLALSSDVAEVKNGTGAALYQPAREKELIQRLQARAPDLPPEIIKAIFRQITAASLYLQKPQTIAYLGPEGTFSHQAASDIFMALPTYLGCGTIKTVFEAVANGRAGYGVVPIENMLDGAVGETLDYLGASKTVKIVAEKVQEIHFVLATQAATLGDIKVIYSKDKAFGQCRNFLDHEDLADATYMPMDSTAKAAAEAAKNPNAAAICSKVAARRYELPILFDNIESTGANKTRFVVLGQQSMQEARPASSASSKGCKTTILATTPNEPGALFTFLELFKTHDINMTKIESRPSSSASGSSISAAAGDFTSCFYIDFEGHIQDKNVQKAFENHWNHLTWLGSYPTDS